MPTVKIEYYGVEGSGRNVTEAKKDAGRKIEQSLAGSYTPEILTWRGYAILVYREPSGWHTRVIADPDGGVREGPAWGSLEGDKAETVKRARRHLADLGWKAEDGLTPPAFLTDRADVAEYQHKAKFQLRYREARARGLSDGDAHDYAGRNPSRPELWLEDERSKQAS